MKIGRQKFAGEQTDPDLINLTAVYLLHCLVFCNLSQHTSISPSYHQHLERVERREGMRVKREVGRKERQKRRRNKGTQYRSGK